MNHPEIFDPFYKEVSRLQETLLQVRHTSSLFNVEFRRLDDGLGIFVAGRNEAGNPDILVSVGAVNSVRGIRGELTIYREQSNDELRSSINPLAKFLRERLDGEATVIVRRRLPRLHLPRIPAWKFQQPLETIVPGASISASRQPGSGSLGFFATFKSESSSNPHVKQLVAERIHAKATGQAIVLVSAGHVLIPRSAGDQVTVYHPGERVAKALEIYPKRVGHGVAGIAPVPGRQTSCDAAMSLLNEDVKVNHHDVESGEIVGWLTQEEFQHEELLNGTLFKVGAGTGLRRGTIAGVQDVEPFRMRNDEDIFEGVARLRNVIRIESQESGEHFSSDTDSGAPVLWEREKGKFVLCGIVIGGHESQRGEEAYSLMCPIWTIKDALDIAPLTGEEFRPKGSV